MKPLVDDRGSTMPLILGFFVVGLLTVGAAIAAGQAFVQQRGLQDLCDGAALAGAASAADLDRATPLTVNGSLHFSDVQRAVDGFLAAEPPSTLQVVATVSADGRTLRLQCSQTLRIAFGSAFGRPSGVHHVAYSSARAPVT